jgi:nickel superoxide dismutase
MKRKISHYILVLFSLVLVKPLLFSHCEVPCGIYDDQMRIRMISEHITTIEKAMKQIQEFSKQEPMNHNQIVRWVVNKEKHAEEIQHIVSQYFLTQRIKFPAKEDTEAVKSYQLKLSLCHSILVYAMKSKQTVDLVNVEKLKSILHSFEHSYFGKK